MKRPLVYPRSSENDTELNKLIEFYNETLRFCPKSIKTMHIRPRIAYSFIEMNKAVMENKGRAALDLTLASSTVPRGVNDEISGTTGKHTY